MAQPNSIRTPDELNDIAFNYFIAFKVDLKQTDKAKIEPQIKKILGDPKGSVHSRRLLELKTDILEIMCNDAVYDPSSGQYRPNAGGRAKEAEAAKKFKLKETLDLVQTLCKTRTTLLKSEIKGIYDTANSPVTYFTEAELDAAIQPLLSVNKTLKIIDNLDSSIPFAKYQKAELQLKPLDKKDLYDFLGCAPNAPQSDLQTKNDEQYKNSSKISDLKKKQSISTLCATVKELLLKSPQDRKNYDNYIALKDKVWADFEKFKSFGIKELNMDAYTKYAQTIVDTLRVSMADAEKMLGVGCKYYQLTLIGSGNAQGSKLEICPYPACGLLFPKGLKNCPHCGKPLEVGCWNCSQSMPLTKDDKGCPSCGATQHAHGEFLKKCGLIDGLLNKPVVDITELKSAFLSLKNIVPNYAQKTNSTIYKKATEYDKVIQAKVKQEETMGAAYRAEVVKIRELIAQKKYQSAYSLVKALQTKFGTYDLATTNKLLSDVTAIINSAQRQAETAKSYAAQNNANMAVAAAVKALEISVDYTEARQILQKFPPKPVSNLRATLDGSKICLEWEDRIKQDYTTYTIIKKVGVAPINAEDGALVDKGLSIKFFEDQNVISATPYYYAVFADRYGVTSPLCTTSMPIMVYSDVLNVQQEFVTSGIKVVWEAPQNVKSIEVWKKEGAVAPLKAGDGVKVSTTNKGFYDEKSTGENAYLIICNYQVKDKTVQSKGVKVVFKPYEKTVPLEKVSIEPVGANKYVFSCAEGYAGNVSLYYSNTKLPIQTNTVLKYIDFNTICKGMTKLTTSLTVDGKISFTIPQGRIGQVYPIVATEQLFVVSPPTIVNTIEGMNATHKFANGVLTISGPLHPKASSVIVKVSHQKYPQTMKDEGENFTFAKDVLTRQGKIEIKLKSNTVNYVTIFAEFVEDGIKTYSQPMQLNPPIDYRETVTVLYCLEAKPSAVKSFPVTIKFEAESEVEIPSLLLMKGHPRPMNKNAGELCERINPIQLKKGLFGNKYKGKCVIKAEPTANNTRFAIFLSEEGGHVRFKEVQKL